MSGLMKGARKMNVQNARYATPTTIMPRNVAQYERFQELGLQDKTLRTCLIARTLSPLAGTSELAVKSVL